MFCVCYFRFDNFGAKRYEKYFALLKKKKVSLLMFVLCAEMSITCEEYLQSDIYIC